jgi:hypothetical protein
VVARGTRRAKQIYFLERACQAQIAAQAGGGKLVLPPESVRLRTAAQFHDFPDVPFYCDLAWEAALRSLTWRTDSALLLTIAGLVFREEKAQVGK